MKKMITAIAVLTGLILFVWAYYRIALSEAVYMDIKTDNRVENLVVTGHRGAAGLAPENTLPSIQKALEFGVHRIEIDVQQTKDSVVIVLHDTSVDRTTNGTGQVKDMTYAEIQKLDAGSSFSSNYAGVPIPTLQEAFELINGQSVFLIEIKDGSEVYPDIEKRIVDMIRHYQAEDWVILQSFNTSVLERLHKLAPDLELHKLFVAQLPWIKRLYSTGVESNSLADFDYVTEFSTYYKFTNQELIDEIHAAGKKINVWTVNDELSMERLRKMGVDGIITNFPDKLLPKK